MHYYHLLRIKYEILNKWSVPKTMATDLQNSAGRERNTYKISNYWRKQKRKA